MKKLQIKQKAHTSANTPLRVWQRTRVARGEAGAGVHVRAHQRYLGAVALARAGVPRARAARRPAAARAAPAAGGFAPAGFLPTLLSYFLYGLNYFNISYKTRDLGFCSGASSSTQQ